MAVLTAEQLIENSKNRASAPSTSAPSSSAGYQPYVPPKQDKQDPMLERFNADLAKKKENGGLMSWLSGGVNALAKTGEAMGEFGIGFGKEAIRTVGAMSDIGEEILSFGKADDTLGGRVAQSEVLKPTNTAQKVGAFAENVAEAYAGGVAIGAPKTALAAFIQGSALAEAQMTKGGVIEGKTASEAALDSLPWAIAAGGVSAGIYKVFSALSGGERGLAKQFNKELQPPKGPEIAKLKSGFKSIGDDIANITDDAGNKVYVGKSYDGMIDTAKEQIDTNAKVIRSALENADNTNPMSYSREPIRKALLENMENTYGALEKQQVKTINKFVDMLPENMTRAEMHDSRMSIDKLLKRKDFQITDGPKAFATEVKLLVRDNLRKMMEQSVDDISIRDINQKISTAFNVRDLAYTQKFIKELEKESSSKGMWATIGRVIDDVIFTPEVSTRIPSAAASAAKGAPTAVGGFGGAFGSMMQD